MNTREFFPNSYYPQVVLQVLYEMGGGGATAEVLDLVHDKLAYKFKSGDLEPPKPGGNIRWKNGAHWARNTLIKDGLMKTDSHRGWWELSDIGLDQARRLRDRFD